jgi:hypothetical protein
VGDRRAPQGHDRVADELLDHAAVALDGGPGPLEVAGEDLAYLFGVARLGERGEANQVGEEHGDQAAFGDRGRSRLVEGVRGRADGRAARVAKAVARLDGVTVRAGQGER